jgi:hypothetical protein
MQYYNAHRNATLSSPNKGTHKKWRPKNPFTASGLFLLTSPKVPHEHCFSMHNFYLLLKSSNAKTENSIFLY